MYRLLLILTLTGSLTIAATSMAKADEEQRVTTAEDGLRSLGRMALPRSNEKPLILDLGGPRYQVFCFVGCECPLARLYGQKLNLLAERYREHGFDFIGVNSNQQDSLEEVGDYRRELGIQFPVVKDYDNRLADLLSAERTPEVIIVSPERKIVYRGRVDNQYSPGIARAAATQ